MSNFATDQDASRTTNKRALPIAALDMLAGYQIEGCGRGRDGTTYLRVKLGMDPVVKVRLVGLEEVTLDEVKS